MSEHEEQAELMRWARMHEARCPELALLFAVPNGGARHIAVAARLQHEGVKAGVPDLHLPVARGEYHGLWLEMKVGRNRPTSAQVWWIEHLREQGYRVAVCYDWHQAWAVICDYLGITPPEEVT